MGLQDRYDKMVVRQGYRNVWHTSLMDTMKVDLPNCLLAACCPQCVSYKLRKRALHNDMSRYQCCGGYMPCSGKCRESQCPEFCLCTEVFCCFSNSVASTRFLLQDEFNIQTTKCDNGIIGFMFCLGQFACIFRLIAAVSGSDELEDASELLTCFSDTVFCTVCACMQAQHKIEMDKRDGRFGPLPVMMVPPVQQMSQFDQPVPPSVGHPPQPGHWKPAYDYACPPYIPGYPAAGHPVPPPGHSAAAHPLPPPGYSAAAHPLPPPGYPVNACPLPASGYYPAGCPPPTQNFPSVEHPAPPPPPPQGHHK